MTYTYGNLDAPNQFKPLTLESLNSLIETIGKKPPQISIYVRTFDKFSEWAKVNCKSVSDVVIDKTMQPMFWGYPMYESIYAPEDGKPVLLPDMDELEYRWVKP